MANIWWTCGEIKCLFFSVTVCLRSSIYQLNLWVQMSEMATAGLLEHFCSNVVSNWLHSADLCPQKIHTLTAQTPSSTPLWAYRTYPKGIHHCNILYAYLLIAVTDRCFLRIWGPWIPTFDLLLSIQLPAQSVFVYMVDMPGLRQTAGGRGDQGCWGLRTGGVQFYSSAVGISGFLSSTRTSLYPPIT